MSDPHPEQQATIDAPRAVRVKTSTGWADLAIKGAPGKDGANFNYLGDYSATVTYNHGDMVVGPDGITYLCVNDGTKGVAPAPWATAWAGVPLPVVNGQWVKGVGGAAVWAPLAAYGTTLPASPLNGDEAVLVDSVTNPSYQWRLRYNAGSTSAYKWEFVGGAPASSGADPLEATTSTTYVALPTPGPSITLPRAGDYLISINVDMSAAPNNDTARASFDIGATVANDNDSVTFNNSSSAVMGSTVYCSRIMARTGLPAVALVMKYRTIAGGNCQFRRRSMSVWPIRVS